MPDPVDRARPGRPRHRLQRGSGDASRRRCAAASRPRSRLRMPELVEAIRRAGATGKAQRVEFFERVPLDRWFEAFVTPVRCSAATGRAGMVCDHLQRSDADAPRRGDARRLRRQCQPRIAHAARRAAPASSRRCRARRATMPRRASASSASCRRRPARMARLIDDLLSLSRIELQRASAARHAGRSRRRSCARSPTACRRWRATARSRSRSTAPAEPLIVLGDRDELIRAVRESDRERAEIRRRRQARRHRAVARADARRQARGARRRARLRPRHRARASAAPDRALLPRRRRATAARRAAPASASRWSSTSSTATAAGSRSRAGAGEGATFTVHLPLAHRAPPESQIAQAFNRLTLSSQLSPKPS